MTPKSKTTNKIDRDAVVHVGAQIMGGMIASRGNGNLADRHLDDMADLSVRAALALDAAVPRNLGKLNAGEPLHSGPRVAPGTAGSEPAPVVQAGLEALSRGQEEQTQHNVEAHVQDSKMATEAAEKTAAGAVSAPDAHRLVTEGPESFADPKKGQKVAEDKIAEAGEHDHAAGVDMSDEAGTSARGKHPKK